MEYLKRYLGLVMLIPRGVVEVFSPQNWFVNLFKDETPTPKQAGHVPNMVEYWKGYLFSAILVVALFFLVRYLYFKYIKLK